MNINKNSNKPTLHQFVLQPENNQNLAELCGQFNQNIKLIEERLNVNISNRGNQFSLSGERDRAIAAKNLLLHLYRQTGTADPISLKTVHLFLQESSIELMTSDVDADLISIKTHKGLITPKGINQKNYLRSILKNDINFGIGPAGTGKTYLAVAAAVQALENEQVRRILLVRPAVEAGEKLGFLPGDLSQKIDPYLRPLYDALYEMLGFERVEKYIEKNIIEVAPLAYMRGRTINHSFVILDESQNTTFEQMKMFLTRIGFGSTAVLNGDITQIDLAKGTRSGLRSAVDILKEVKGIGFTWFSAKDVVRHPLVQRIVEAYDEYDNTNKIHRQTTND